MKFFLILTSIIISFQLAAQSKDGKYEKAFEYGEEKIIFISEDDSTIWYHIGDLYKIMSLKDSIVFERSYPWHRKTLMVYHINDYHKILGIDTNRAKYDKWIPLNISKVKGNRTLHIYALPLDTLRHRYAPDTIYAWVDLQTSPPNNWITQTLNLFKVFDGIPENALVKSIVYGREELSLLDLVLTDEITDSESDVYHPVTIETMYYNKRIGKPWSD